MLFRKPPFRVNKKGVECSVSTNVFSHPFRPSTKRSDRTRISSDTFSQAFLELFFPCVRDALSSLTLNSKPKVVLRYLQ